MKRILWLTNVRFSTSNIKATGTWLQPLAQYLTSQFEIYHISRGNVKETIKEDIYGIKQYTLPYRKTIDGTQKPDNTTCKEVENIIKDVNPELIHVWGTESIWAYMKVLGIYNNYKVLLDMQGLMQSCYEFYYGGLAFTERLKCYGLKELIKPSTSISAQRRKFKRWAVVEKEILSSYDFISYQSEWIKNRLTGLGVRSLLFPTRILLRKEFYTNSWKLTSNTSPVLFTISSGTVPYKGLHILIKACTIIKKRYPNFVLNVVGNIMGSKYGIKSGYNIYLSKLIKKYNLDSNIHFCGSLSSDKIIEFQKSSDVCVVPSFVESYCLGLAEAMIIGVPTVTAYSAAMPTIAQDKTETLFYTPNDYVDCAVKILKLFEDKQLAMSISNNARKRRMLDNNINDVVDTQISIYNNIINEH